MEKLERTDRKFGDEKIKVKNKKLGENYDYGKPFASDRRGEFFFASVVRVDGSVR